MFSLAGLTMHQGAMPGVTLTGLCDTQSLDDFLLETTPTTRFEDVGVQHSDTIGVLTQKAEIAVDAAFGGSGIMTGRVDELLKWRRPAPFERTAPSPEQDETHLMPVIHDHTTRDPIITAVHASLHRAGYLVQDGNRLYVRDIDEWREGLEVVEIIDAHTIPGTFDLLDIIRGLDWGPFKPFGQKNINGSFRALGQFERHGQLTGPKDIHLVKFGCLTHAFQGRGGSLLGHLEMVECGIAKNHPIMLATTEACLTPDFIGRLIIEYEVAQRMRRQSDFFERALAHVTNPDYFAIPLSSFFGLSFEELTQMTREEYLALSRAPIARMATQYELTHPLYILTHLQEDNAFTEGKRDITNNLRNLRIDFILMERMDPARAPHLKKLRIAIFLSRLASTLPALNLNDPDRTKAEVAHDIWATIMHLIEMLRELITRHPYDMNSSYRGYYLIGEVIAFLNWDRPNSTFSKLQTWAQRNLDNDSDLRFEINKISETMAMLKGQIPFFHPSITGNS